MKILYLDCSAGISGDMTVGTLIDLGVPIDTLLEGLASLQLPEGAYLARAEKTARNGISATHFMVEAPESSHHRHFPEIADLIATSSLPGPVRKCAQRIFLRLAEAEAKVHGVPVEQVHFHEVGATDSIVDIVATAIGIHYLGVVEIQASAVPYGSGWVETAHGRLPVPAPATAELLCGLPIVPDPVSGEWVTPTGAAILASLASKFGAPPPMNLTAVGYGAGTRECHARPNLLRGLLGVSAELEGQALVIETNIDDMNPELLGYLMELLLKNGALDVTFSPLQMKKNRPGTRLTAIAPQKLLEIIANIILTESSAIGLRYYPVGRFTLERKEEYCMTSLGETRVKRVKLPDGTWRTFPEFEECRRLATESNTPLLDVYRLIERETTAQR